MSTFIPCPGGYPGDMALLMSGESCVRGPSDARAGNGHLFARAGLGGRAGGGACVGSLAHAAAVDPPAMFEPAAMETGIVQMSMGYLRAPGLG